MMAVSLLDTIDARAWVKRWLEAIEENPNIPTSEGAMLGWFAYAIRAGYDAGEKAAQQKLQATEKASAPE